MHLFVFLAFREEGRASVVWDEYPKKSHRYGLDFSMVYPIIGPF
jgi:hypothetical protein